MKKIDKNNISKIVGNNLLLDEYMSKHTTFGIGGKVCCYIMPKTIEQLKDILEFIERCI